MKHIKADGLRVMELAGVPDPVHRPVDIDQKLSGFLFLRSLRVYCFTAGSVIVGHAENDEVLLVLLAGTVQLTLSDHELDEFSPQFTLSVVGNDLGHPCVAYLPPHGSYRLIPQSDAEVAYIRAMTIEKRRPQVFSARPRCGETGTFVLIEEAGYAYRLRLRVVELMASQDGIAIEPVEATESQCEVFVHLRTSPAQNAISILDADREPVALESQDTVALDPGERATLSVAGGASALMLVILA